MSLKKSFVLLCLSCSSKQRLSFYNRPIFYSLRKLSDEASPKRTTTIVSKSELEDLDTPIKFSTSGASKWKASDSLEVKRDWPQWQGHVITLSMFAIMLYFFVLREENDMDEQLKKTIWERIPGLEKQQLEVMLDFNKERSLPVDDIKKRLKEINDEEKGKNKN